MTPQPSPLPEELQAALEDVRQVRDTLGKLRLSHPIREMIEPMRIFSFVMAPILLGYGVLMQRWFDASATHLFGMPKRTFVWVASLTFVVLSSIAKGLIYRKASQARGYSYSEVIRRVLWVDGYIRIVVAVMSVLGILIAVFVHSGQAYQIPGLIAICSGAIVILIPLAFPLPELTWVGVVSLVTGGASMFMYPAYPFYKAGVLFFMICMGFGFTTVRLNPKTESTS